MKVFSEGFISAPQLPYIDASLEKWDPHWEGDLNSTIKKLFKGKVMKNFNGLMHIPDLQRSGRRDLSCVYFTGTNVPITSWKGH